MKSSTLHRANLSRERLSVLEELLSEKGKEHERTAEQYNRQNKERELDILWQGLKNHKDERSPGVYLSVGFVTGAICMFLMTSILNLGHRSENVTDLNLWKKSSMAANKQVAVNVAPAAVQSANIRTQKYSIKSGDTLEKVSVKFYGSFNPERIQDIQDINNITNPNSIQIGQELTIPIYE